MDHVFETYQIKKRALIREFIEDWFASRLNFNLICVLLNAQSLVLPDINLPFNFIVITCGQKHHKELEKAWKLIKNHLGIIPDNACEYCRNTPYTSVWVEIGKLVEPVGTFYFNHSSHY